MAGAQVLRRLRKICLGLPEVSEAESFGHRVWKAGKKTFCGIEPVKGRSRICFRADWEQHPHLVEQARFEVAPYVGQHGWLLLDAEGPLDWGEIEDLVTSSYRLFALRRMLKELD